MTLPRGWMWGRSFAEIRRIHEVEERAARRELRTSVDWKGYVWVSLCRRHPYANPRGMQYLHRYVMMRHLGLVLDRFQHVHHPPGVPRDCWDPERLEVLEEIHHAHYHDGRRIACGVHIDSHVWTPRDDRGRFTAMAGSTR